MHRACVQTIDKMTEAARILGNALNDGMVGELQYVNPKRSPQAAAHQAHIHAVHPQPVNANNN
jgi:hypothetical protein